ncbi:MAG: response regulator transcription factor [Deltaproteobacteria bacterium]|nr:response regulator transcription factor [Deltaproteobacteria bacterium]
MSERILIVDDEADVVSTIAYRLQREGFETLSAATGREALELARSERPALVLLDLMLPDTPGTEVCRKLLADPVTRHIPVVMLTARADEIDRIVGLELGSSDYITKPFSPRELVLRIRAILRRVHPDAPAVDDQRLVAGAITIDAAAHRVLVDGTDAGLTARELALLATLTRRPGRVYSRAQLLGAVWPEDAEVLERSVDAMVMRVRGKLGDAAAMIETVRGVGYRLRPPDRDDASAAS